MQRLLTRRGVLAVAALSLGACSRQLSESAAPEVEPSGDTAGETLLSTYYPTPMPVVRRMLEMAGLEAGDLHYDLGSGDGRIVVVAAQEFRARSVGFEIDSGLVEQSRAWISELGLEDRARIERQDLLEADYSRPEVITAFLTPEALEVVTPRLRGQLRPDARIASYKFPLPGWDPVDRWEMADPDPEIPLHEVFLYQRS